MWLQEFQMMQIYNMVHTLQKPGPKMKNAYQSINHDLHKHVWCGKYQKEKPILWPHERRQEGGCYRVPITKKEIVLKG